MNEITKIHLGRQVFTIAVDAHKLLRAYLQAIEKQAGDGGDEVVKEVESRMAELLVERGVTPEKAVLTEDVEYLQEQLGDPRDFNETDDDEVPRPGENGEQTPRRLFRDTEHGIIAGVAAGLAAYTGISPLIIRLAFVILGFWGATGVLVYLLLWLLVPEAKTPSDRLQMYGKPVTVENLKEALSRADVHGAARRVSLSASTIGEKIAMIFLTAVGVVLLAMGFAMLTAASVATTYLLVHGLRLGGSMVFPLGFREHILLLSGLGLVLLVTTMMALLGRAFITKRWRVPGWVVVGILLAGVVVISAGTALGFDRAPTLRQRYDSIVHTSVRQVGTFQSIHMNVSRANYIVEYGSTYDVEIHSFGSVDTSTITTTLDHSELMVDDSKLQLPSQSCSIICPYGPSNVQIVVHAPVDFNGPVSSDDPTFYGPATVPAPADGP